jgi:hypothetical protein
MLVSAQAAFRAQSGTIKLVFLVLFLWFTLYQLVPLYLGWKLVRAEKAVAPQVAVVAPSGDVTVVTTADEDTTAS